MSISDAAFLTWLGSSTAQRCSLFELTYLGDNAGAPGEMHAYVSDRGYVTGHTDTPADRVYEACVVGTPTFSRRMGEQLRGRTTQSYGDLLISNENGARDSWLSMNWDGRRLRQWLGDKSWPFTDFRLVLDGVIVDIFEASSTRIGFKISDKAALLDRPVMTTLLGGTGAAAGELMPLCLGFYNINITPKLVDETDHVYRFTQVDAGGLIEAPYYSNVAPENPYTVREAGVSLRTSTTLTANTPADDLFQKTAHGWVAGTRLCFRPYGGSGNEPPAPLAYSTTAIAQTYYWVSSDGLTADAFKLAPTLADAIAGTNSINITGTITGSVPVQAMGWTSPGDGTFQLAGNPIGLITCDCYGLGTGASFPQTYMQKAGQIIEQILTSGITNTPLTAADIDATSLADFITDCPKFCSAYVTERTTFTELIDQLVLSVGGYWGFSRDGLLQFGRFDLPDELGTPVYSFAGDDVALRSLRLLKRILPRAEIKLIGATNYTVQQTVNGSVSEADRVYWATPNVTKTGAATVTTWDTDPTNHLGALRPDAYQTYISNASDLQTEANRVATIFQYPNGIWGFDTSQVVFTLKIGDLIYIEHPRRTAFGIVTACSERVKGRSAIEYFATLPDVYPTGDIA